MAAKTPLAFLSYAHSDDEHENGRLREFARRLSSEVRLQWGEDFPIFVDRNELKWGQEWKARIEQSLDGVTFLVPIVTPGYLKSDWCRKEFLRFVKREEELKRRDLILPVYYVRCPVLDDDEKRSRDELARVLHERQYKDWRRFRHEPWTAPEVGRQFEQMAQEIVEALDRGGLVQSPVAIMAGPPTVVVDAMYRGDFTSIAEAIKAAKAGTRILVRPGHYREALVIDKPLEIVGEGNRDDVVVEATGASVIHFTASMGRVANLTLRQAASDKWYVAQIAGGRLDLEDCDISGGIAVSGGAEPRVRRNRIHDGDQPGIFVYENAGGLVIETGSATIRRNRIHGCEYGILQGAAGLIEENDIFANAISGVGIGNGANPTVRRNRIRDNKGPGCFVFDGGTGLIEDNDILSNSYSGCEVWEGGNPVVRHNRIGGNREGIRVHNGGRGTFEYNTISENHTRDWDIVPDCLPNVKRSNNIEE